MQATTYQSVDVDGLSIFTAKPARATRPACFSCTDFLRRHACLGTSPNLAEIHVLDAGHFALDEQADSLT